MYKLNKINITDPNVTESTIEKNFFRAKLIIDSMNHMMKNKNVQSQIYSLVLELAIQR